MKLELTETQVKTLRIALEAWKVRTENLTNTYGDNEYHQERMNNINDARKALYPSLFLEQPSAPYLGD